MSRGTALVTGASAGIGEAIAKLLAAEGFNLVLTARRVDKLKALQASLSDEVDVRVIPADLADPAGVRQLCEELDQTNIDVLVNNAGTMIHQEFIHLTTDEIDQLISLNITALTMLTHHFLLKMRAVKSGRILNVASMAAFHPVPGLDIYAATKAYVLSLTESLAEELRGSGVSITALCPGLTATDMVDQRTARSVPPFFLTTPEQVASEGFEAMMKREVIRVPGSANKLALTWAQHQPRWLVRGLGGMAARFGGSSGRKN